MIQRDYVLRLIEQFFILLRRILNHEQEQQYEQALGLIRRAYKTFLAADADFIDSQSADDLIATMRSGLLGPEQIAMAAKLLTEEAKIREGLEEDDEALDRRRKALRLYLEVFCGPGAPRLEGFLGDIEQLADSLAKPGIPIASARLLPLYWEKVDRFDRAEDALYAVADAAGPEDPAWSIGRELYARLAALTDEQLDQGGLPRDEVESGAEEWERRAAGRVS